MNNTFGKHAGKRASHAKGLCATGVFTPASARPVSSIAWPAPASRGRAAPRWLGTLAVQALDDAGACDGVVFMPGNLPASIAMSDDPILRSHASVPSCCGWRACTFVGPDAEDAVQETLLGALKGWNDYAGKASVRSWLTASCASISSTSSARGAWRRWAATNLTAAADNGK